jgi:peptidoglycan-associated lipoprotein
VDTVGTTGVGDAGSTLPGRGAPGTEDREALRAQSVYFAYDSAAINPSEQSKLQAVADYLKANAGKRVLIEGHCDERGTSEYNRALGERRALAAREALISLGVDGGSLQTISYGEDKPADPGHDEAAWSRNRRDDFVVLH